MHLNKVINLRHYADFPSKIIIWSIMQSPTRGVQAK